MSGPKCASYQIDPARAAMLHAQAEAERVRAREQARLEGLRRQWQATRHRHQQLRQRAEALRSRYRFEAPEVADLPDVRALGADSLENELADASAAAAMLDKELSRQERFARDVAARSSVADVVKSAGAAGPADRARPDRRRRTAATPLAPADALEKDLARSDEILARLDAEIDVPAPVTVLLAALPGAEPGRRRMLLDQLRTDIDALNSDTRARRDHAVALAEAHQVAEQSGDAELRALLARAVVDPGGFDLAALRAAVDAAARRQAQEREREYVAQVVLDVFRELRYDVVAGFEVQTPSEGMLVRRGSSSAHGVQVRVQGGSVNVEAVRLTEQGGADIFTADDRRAQEELCHVTPQLWHAMSRKGVGISGVTAVPVGVMVPSAVKTGATAAVSATQVHHKPTVPAKERRLR